MAAVSEAVLVYGKSGLSLSNPGQWEINKNIDHNASQCAPRNTMSMRKFSAVFLVLCATTLITTTASADEKIYELQYMFVDSDLKGDSFEPHALQFKYIKPYSPMIELEAMIALGINEKKITRKEAPFGTFTQKLRLSNIIGVFAKAHAELEPTVRLYGHIGLARVEYNISTSISGVTPDGTESDSGFAYGFGLSFAVFEKGAFIIEYDQYPDIAESNSTINTAALSVGYQMPF